MDSLTKSYIAGFFDGEGSVSIAWPKGYKGLRYPRLVMTFSQNTRDILDWIRSLNSNKGTITWCTTAYNYSLSCNVARQLLRELLPYLRVKKEAVARCLAEDEALTIPYANSTKRRAANLIVHYLQSLGHPAHRRELFEAVTKAGISFGGKDSLQTFSASVLTNTRYVDPRLAHFGTGRFGLWGLQEWKNQKQSFAIQWRWQKPWLGAVLEDQSSRKRQSVGRTIAPPPLPHQRSKMLRKYPC